MKTPKTVLILALAATPCIAGAQAPAAGAAPTDPNWQYAPEEFGVGRTHVKNAWCNRQIDRLLDETRQCFNTRPARDCDDLQKKNSKKIGGYIKSPRCMK